jgi:hypothetical protein
MIDQNTTESHTRVGSDAVFGRTLFVYARDGQIKCYSADELRPTEETLMTDGWKHTATIDPARWIERMANGSENPSDILDELQFSPATCAGCGEKEDTWFSRSEPMGYFCRHCGASASSPNETSAATGSEGSENE